MSAVELLEQVKTLPAAQREKFVLAILELEESPLPLKKAKNKPVKWPDVEARSRKIMGKKTLPNLVILEREENVY